MLRIVYYFLFIVIFVFGITFSILNIHSVTIYYYVGQSTLPLSLLVGLVFVLGSMFGMMIGCWWFIKEKWRNYRLARRLVKVEKEIKQLHTSG